MICQALVSAKVLWRSITLLWASETFITHEDSFIDMNLVMKGWQVYLKLTGIVWAAGGGWGGDNDQMFDVWIGSYLEIIYVPKRQVILASGGGGLLRNTLSLFIRLNETHISYMVYWLQMCGMESVRGDPNISKCLHLYSVFNPKWAGLTIPQPHNSLNQCNPDQVLRDVVNASRSAAWSC